MAGCLTFSKALVLLTTLKIKRIMAHICVISVLWQVERGSFWLHSKFDFSRASCLNRPKPTRLGRHTFSPSAQLAEAGGSLGQLVYIVRPCLEK